MFIMLMLAGINVIMLNIWKVGMFSAKTVSDLSEFMADIGPSPRE